MSAAIRAVPIVLQASGLDVGYRGRQVLAAVELSIARSEFWCVVGPNGSGKTTLLSTLMGTLEPVAGKVVRGPTAADPRAIGFVPQRCDLRGGVATTVREFVGLGTIGVARSRADRAERVAESTRIVGLGERLRDDYRALSGGQRQRALVARALARRPQLLYLDEPTSGLDAPSSRALLEILRSWSTDSGATVIFVIHDLGVARRLADRVALCGMGRVVAGAPRDVLSRDHLTDAYGDDPLDGAAE